MEISRKITVECPHCGHLNRMSTQGFGDGEARVIYCNFDEGGCDRPFVVRLSVAILVDVATLNWASRESAYTGHINQPDSDDCPQEDHDDSLCQSCDVCAALTAYENGAEPFRTKEALAFFDSLEGNLDGESEAPF